jgi:hypothetical protein
MYVAIVVLLTLVLASPVVLARGSGRDASTTPRPASVTGDIGDGTLTLGMCEKAVSVLLAQDLTRVASGQPDAPDPIATDALLVLGGPGTPATSAVASIHDELIGTATTDVINAYQRDVARLLSAYAARVALACQRVSTG